jgi:hypothetical protein
MIQNLTLRIIVGVAVGVAAWFVLLRLLSIGGGITNDELIVVAVLAVAATIATVIGLGRNARPPVQR